MVFSPPFDEFIQPSIPSAQEEHDVVSYFPFQVLDYALYHDSRNKEVLEEPLDSLDPSCYNKCDDVIENIDEFIHVGRYKWDVIFPSGDPIYDIEGHLNHFP